MTAADNLRDALRESMRVLNAITCKLRLQEALFALMLAGGAVAGQLVPSIVLEAGHNVATFEDTGANGIQNKSSRLSIDFDVVFEDFFRCARSGHFGVMERASMELVAVGQYRGHGAIFGNIWRASGGTANVPDYRPFGVIESWGIGIVPDSFGFLLPRSASPQLADWVQYKISVQSTRTILNFVRYRIHRLDFVRSQYELIFDSGDVLDNNWGVDMTRQAVIFFAVLDETVCPGRVRIINPIATWTPADTDLPDLTALPWRRP